MSKFVKLSLILNIFLFVGCSDNNSIIAIAETDPVTTSGDAADDPAIIIDYRNPKESIILGTDKRAGVYSYDLSGKKISYDALGAAKFVNPDALSFKDGSSSALMKSS